MFTDDGVISNPPDELNDFNESIELTTNWTTRLSGINTEQSSLTIANNEDSIFVISGSNETASLNMLDGSINWTVSLAQRLVAGPAAANSSVYVGSADGTIFALSASEGEELWSVELDKEIASPISVSSQAIIFGTSDGTLYALSPTNGSIIWNIQHEAPVLTVRGSTQSIISGNTIVAGFDSGRIGNYDLFSGVPLWEASVSIPAGTSQLERLVDVADKIALRGNTIYAVNANGYVVAIDVNSGQMIWRQPISSLQGLALGSNQVVVVNDDSDVIAFNMQTSEQAWAHEELTNRDLTAPAVVNQVAAFGDFEGYVHFLNLSDGSIAQRLSHGRESIVIDPIAIDANIIVLSRDGLIASYSVAN
jgi:outer membrane protein assembly factor BamB